MSNPEVPPTALELIGGTVGRQRLRGDAVVDAEDGEGRHQPEAEPVADGDVAEREFVAGPEHVPAVNERHSLDPAANRKAHLGIEGEECVAAGGLAERVARADGILTVAADRRRAAKLEAFGDEQFLIAEGSAHLRAAGDDHPAQLAVQWSTA